VPKGQVFPDEFRREAVELAKTSGKTMTAVAQELGIARETLRRWLNQAEIDAGEREGLTSEEREELRQLRRELRVVTQEREILKKAAAFFAKESETR
jgi:transposase